MTGRPDTVPTSHPMTRRSWLPGIRSPVQDIAYAAMAARTVIGGAATAQGLVTLTLAFSEITGNVTSGSIADSFGWNWVPVVVVVLAGLALIVGLASRKLRDRMYAEAG